MTVDLAALLNPGERATDVRKIESVLQEHTTGDVLHILTIVADNALQRITSAEDRKRIGPLFLKELQLRVALREYSDAEREDLIKRRERDEITVNHIYAKQDDADSLACGLVDCCIWFSYRSILHAFPMAVGTILRDCPKDHDRNNMVLDVIQSAVYRRFKLNPERASQELQLKARPLIERLKAVADDRLRCTAVLEMIDLLASLAETDKDE